MTFWKRAELMPPILVRLLARTKHGPPLQSLEIADRSGLPVPTMDLLSKSTSWIGWDFPTARRFLVACGCDFCDRKHMRRVDAYSRSKPTWQYLRKSPEWKQYYEPLLRRWRASVMGVQNQNQTKV